MFLTAHSGRLIQTAAALTLTWTGALGNTVDIHLSPADRTAAVGALIEIDLVAVAGTDSPQYFDALDAILSWDPAALQLLGFDDYDSAIILHSGFLNDPDGVNDRLDDGEAIYTALVAPDVDLMVPPAPGERIVTTFRFRALSAARPALVRLQPASGNFGESQVLLDGMNVTGTLGRIGQVTSGPPLTNLLTLEADTCQVDQTGTVAGFQIFVQLWMRDLDQLVTGYQAFLAFDDTALTYEGALSSYSDSPFTIHIQSIASADVAAGELRLDGLDFFPPGGGVDADSLLATLVFTVADECDPVAVIFDLNQPFMSELSFEGDPLETGLLDSPDILPDNTCLCPWDFTGDGIVNAADLAQLLGAWAPCPSPCEAGVETCECPWDFNEDCVVNAADLAQLLGAWGPCS